MPFYEYRCRHDPEAIHQFETFQAMRDPAGAACPVHGTFSTERIVSAPTIFLNRNRPSFNTQGESFGQEAVIQRDQIQGDPDAEVVVLMRQNGATYEVVEFLRFGGVNIWSLVDRAVIARSIMGEIISQEIRDVGATHYQFLNNREAAEIARGEYNGPLAEILNTQDYSKGIPIKSY